MKFALPQLQKSFDQAKPILEKITDIKNQISSEIKAIEKFFQSLDINEPISYLVTNPNLMQSINFNEFCNYAGTGSGIATEEFLIWNSDKKRILFVQKKYEASYGDMDGVDHVELNMATMKTLVDRPLIETHFDIRKRMYENHLSDFLSHISKKYELHKVKAEHS